MNPIDSKLKKILAMIDGATSEGEARAASLALQRLLVANNMTIDDIDLDDDVPRSTSMPKISASAFRNGSRSSHTLSRRTTVAATTCRRAMAHMTIGAVVAT